MHFFIFIFIFILPTFSTWANSAISSVNLPSGAACVNISGFWQGECSYSSNSNSNSNSNSTELTYSYSYRINQVGCEKIQFLDSSNKIISERKVSEAFILSYENSVGDKIKFIDTYYLSSNKKEFTFKRKGLIFNRRDAFTVEGFGYIRLSDDGQSMDEYIEMQVVSKKSGPNLLQRRQCKYSLSSKSL